MAHIVAMTTGFLQPYQSVVQVHKQVKREREEEGEREGVEGDEGNRILLNVLF